MNFRLGRIGRIAQAAWLVACAFTLVGFLYCRGNGEAQDFLTWTMQVLSFPLGLLANPLIIVTVFLAQLISPLGSLLTLFGDYVMVWFWFFMLGLIQWFLIVPGAVKLVRLLFARAR